MSQTQVDPIKGACRHLRGFYKLQTSNKFPFPEKIFVRYECERAHPIDNDSEEEIAKCMAQATGCWKEDAASDQ